MWFGDKGFRIKRASLYELEWRLSSSIVGYKSQCKKSPVRSIISVHSRGMCNTAVVQGRSWVVPYAPGGGWRKAASRWTACRAPVTSGRGNIAVTFHESEVACRSACPAPFIYFRASRHALAFSHFLRLYTVVLKDFQNLSLLEGWLNFPQDTVHVDFSPHL